MYERRSPTECTDYYALGGLRVAAPRATMDEGELHERFCHNRSCWAYDRSGEGHIVIHSRKEHRY